jgi:hypothetical protein
VRGHDFLQFVKVGIDQDLIPVCATHFCLSVQDAWSLVVASILPKADRVWLGCVWLGYLEEGAVDTPPSPHFPSHTHTLIAAIAGGTW